MTFHALVIDDSPDILDNVKDRLEALGHTCDCASSLQCARDHLAQSTYSYILLDLEIPVRYGRPSRIPNGQCLLREVRAMKGYEEIPVIVMTTHGHDSPDLAVEVLRCDGASDFVKKPFADSGHTLEKAIRDALDASGRSRPGAATRSGMPRQDPLQPFEEGEMVFSASQVELCGVKICGGPESGVIRRILDQLRHTNPHGRFVRYGGAKLAELVGCDRGQNGVAQAVRDFRDRVCEIMEEEANLKLDRLKDIILNEGGYRLSPKITVRDEGTAPANRRTSDDIQIAAELENERQQWAFEQLQARGELRKADLVERFQCGDKTAERDLRELRRRGLIEFDGPAKTGFWRPTRR